MNGTLVNLNVNPCKMCMPMGAVTALYGIKKCMALLHGSQGCSTYIRRHMATHYNEPVDIASSSLTEEGTVYGGEKNLIQGLVNLIKVYEPEVIGVATTCLAETIGEDIHRIIGRFYEEYPQFGKIVVVPIHSAGYSGSQYEGYMSALYQLVKNIPMDVSKNGRVNIITSQLSPADTRYLKELLKYFSIDYILLPDLSENLNGGYHLDYEKLPQNGTAIEDIRKMAGADLTIELSSFSEDSYSPGNYLKETYGVPYFKCNLPIGLRDNDTLIDILSEISGRHIPDKLKKERSRYLDAMIDAHKYNGEAFAAVYGEPDFVYSTVRMCVENGIVPLISATGTKCNRFRELIRSEIKELMNSFFIERYEILEDVDFQTIEELACGLKVNVLIGNSDGRRISEKLGIELVRRSFPVHDRMGGQRLRMLGYEGSLNYLDEITNVILARKETGFREELYHRYYKGDNEKSILSMNRYLTKTSGAKEEKTIEEKTIEEKEGNVTRHEKPLTDLLDTAASCDDLEKITIQELETGLEEEKRKKSLAKKTATHPCFNCGAHHYARMHLPIAPKCNISCNYCVRKYDCPNESRPGVTTSVLTPKEAFLKYVEVREEVPRLSVVGIAGPGDALADFSRTIETLKLIRASDPDITFCISTNGLMLPQYVDQLIAVGVSHVTVTMNAIDPSIGAKIYRYIDYLGKRFYGEAGAAILLSNQIAGIKLLTDKSIMCKVNIVMMKGINDEHIPEIVKKVKELGAVVTNIMPLIPVKGSVFEKLPPTDKEELTQMRQKCGETLKQMYHCRQCRADAIGTLSKDRSAEFNPCLKSVDDENNSTHVGGCEKAKSVSSYGKTSVFQVAVASKSGVLVDQHFGHATQFYIYEYRNGAVVFLEKRKVKSYCSGVQECDDKEDQIDLILQAISDCKAVIVMRIGEAPKEKLKEKGIRAFTTYGKIEASVVEAAEEFSME